jgi:arylsulfatase
MKLVRLGHRGAWELYDLKADRTETRDLAAERPELVNELAAQWEAWARRADVLPYPDDKGTRPGGNKSSSTYKTPSGVERKRKASQ